MISSAQSIISHNNKLFVTGFQKSEEVSLATLWILNMDGSIEATISLNLSEGYLYSEGVALTIFKNQLFITGSQIPVTKTFTATLWILDTNGNPNKVVLIGESESVSESYFIESKNHKLYITGFQQAGDDYNPTLWINNLDGQILDTIKLDTTDSMGTSLTFYNNHLYVSGGYSFTEKGYLWIRQMDGTYVNTLELSKDPISSLALSVKSLENQILVAGFSEKNNQPVATLWLLRPDGSLNRTIELGQEGAGASRAFFIYLPKKNTQTLENALKTFSHITYQKGV